MLGRFVAFYVTVGLVHFVVLWAGVLMRPPSAERILAYAKTLSRKDQLRFWWSHGPGLILGYPIGWLIFLFMSPAKREEMARDVRRRLFDSDRFAQALKPQLPADWYKVEVLRVRIDSDECPLHESEADRLEREVLEKSAAEVGT